MKFFSIKTGSFLAIGCVVGIIQITFSDTNYFGTLIAGKAIYVSPVTSSKYPQVASESEIRLPLKLTNLSRTKVSLWTHPLSCMPATLEGIPAAIGPWETVYATMVINTNGLNGIQRLQTAMSTDYASQPELNISAVIDIRADVVVRRFGLGPSIPGSRLSKIIHIKNVPASHFAELRVIQPTGWTAELLERSDREMDLRLAGDVPKLQPGGVDVVDFQLDLFFGGGDVRRARVTAKSQIVPEESRNQGDSGN